MARIGVSNLVNDNGFEARNQFVIKTKKATYFQSYDSMIAKIDTNNKLTLTTDWDYSTTTSKYLYMFLRNNYPKYYSLISDNKRKRECIRKAIENKLIKVVKESSMSIS